MYLIGVSVRYMEDITETLWGSNVSHLVFRACIIMVSRHSKKERSPNGSRKEYHRSHRITTECMSEPDSMLSMLEWLCKQLMRAEVSGIVGAEKNAYDPSRRDYRFGYRPRRLDTRMGIMYLMVPKLRSRGYIPFFVTERKRCEAALIQVIQEAFVQGVSTRKMEKLAHSLGIESLSRSQVSEMAKGLNEQVQEFRSRSLAGRYPVIWTDALYEKVRVDGRVISMAVLVACGVNAQGQQEVLAVEPMLDESKESYAQLFQSLEPVFTTVERRLEGSVAALPRQKI